MSWKARNAKARNTIWVTSLNGDCLERWPWSIDEVALIDLVVSFADMPLHQLLGVEEHEMESLDQSSAQTFYYPMPAAPKQASEKVGSVYFDSQLSQWHHG